MQGKTSALLVVQTLALGLALVVGLMRVEDLPTLLIVGLLVALGVNVAVLVAVRAPAEASTARHAEGQPSRGQAAADMRFSARDLVEVVRAYRHGFMNHLQVIGGWLQMGRPERAQEYLARASARAEAESALMRLGDPDVIAVFVVLGARAESLGVAVTYDVRLERLDGNLPAGAAAALEPVLDAALRTVAGRNAEKRLHIGVEAGERIVRVRVSHPGLSLARRDLEEHLAASAAGGPDWETRLGATRGRLVEVPVSGGISASGCAALEVEFPTMAAGAMQDRRSAYFVRSGG